VRFRVGFLKLPGAAGAALGGLENHGQADSCQAIQESREASCPAVAAGLMLDGSCQKQGRQTDEGVNADFLVGPVELRPDGQMLVILELPERGFRLGLAAGGRKDFLVRPAMAVGDE